MAISTAKVPSRGGKNSSKNRSTTIGKTQNYPIDIDLDEPPASLLALKGKQLQQEKKFHDDKMGVERGIAKAKEDKLRAETQLIGTQILKEQDEAIVNRMKARRELRELGCTEEEINSQLPLIDRASLG